MTYSIRIHLRDIIEMLKNALVDMCDVTNNTYEVKAHTCVHEHANNLSTTICLCCLMWT